MSSEIKRGLSAVRAGEMTFDQFARTTRDEWSSLAGYIATRWRLPNWASEEDLRQELLIAAWGAIDRFDPIRGTDEEKFVVWNAVDKAKKRAHKWRGANLHGNPDASPGRRELSIDRTTSQRQDRIQECDFLLGPDEASVQRAVEASLLGECADDAEWLAMSAVLAADGFVHEAADLLYAVPAARLECEMSSRMHARRVVRYAVGAVVARLAKAA